MLAHDATPLKSRPPAQSEAVPETSQLHHKLLRNTRMNKEVSSNHLAAFIEKVENRSLTAGIVGLGYVGLPIAQLFTSRGFNVLGLDIDHVSGYISHCFGRLPGVELLELTDDASLNTDATLILTDHDAFDYDYVVRMSNSVIDTRNANRNIANRDKIILA